MESTLKKYTQLKQLHLQEFAFDFVTSIENSHLYIIYFHLVTRSNKARTLSSKVLLNLECPSKYFGGERVEIPMKNAILNSSRMKRNNK